MGRLEAHPPRNSDKPPPPSHRHTLRKTLIVTTHNDHPTYVKHVLGSIYVLFTLFGYWEPGGSLLRVDSLQGGLAKGSRITRSH